MHHALLEHELHALLHQPLAAPARGQRPLDVVAADRLARPVRRLAHQRQRCRRSSSRPGCGGPARATPSSTRAPIAAGLGGRQALALRRRRRRRWRSAAERLVSHRHVGREVGADAEQRAEVGVAVPERVVVLALADHHDLDVDRHLVGLERPRQPEQAGGGGADVEQARLQRALQRHPGAGHLEHLDGVDDQEPAVGLAAARRRGSWWRRPGSSSARPGCDRSSRSGSAGPGTARSPPAHRSAPCGRRPR